MIFRLPVDYIRYKRSIYYKTTHKKYSFFAGSGQHFEIYNEILENGLPIEYVSNPEEDDLLFGWFHLGNTLVIVNCFSFTLDKETGKWKCYADEEDDCVLITLDEYLENEIRDANELSGKKFCDKAVILINSEELSDVDAAKEETRFLIYDGNKRAEALNSFCEENEE